jgi:glycosyltransferase involved in cell wall biosynthesis
MPEERPPRVLLVAEAANPKGFSVALIGWSFGRALTSVCDPVLATEKRNREDCLAAGARDGIDLEAVDNRFWQHGAWKLSTWLRGGNSLGWSTYSALATLVYPIFERRLWKQFEARLARREFDLVHRITPLAPVVPSSLAGRCARLNIPFMLGPLNGGVPWPKEFPELRAAEREWLYPFRNVYKSLPGFHSTRRNASAILVASRSALRELPEQYHSKTVYIPENAIDPERFPRRTPPAPSTPARAAFVGRLVPLKGVDMLLEAAAPLCREGRLALDIIGDGPELPRLKQLAIDRGIADQVEFPGWVDHSKMADRLGRSQIFAFPSVREFGGGVVLEAMALGLVPLVVDYGGPGELVPEGTGFSIPIAPREKLVADFRDSLTRLISRPDDLANLGKRAQEYVYKHFTWDAKARQIREVYDWVLKRRPTKPDWGIPIRP